MFSLIGLALVLGATSWMAPAPGSEEPRDGGQTPAADRRAWRGGDGEGRHEGRRRPGSSLVIQALDTDTDGELSATEIDNASAALRALDKNSDGKLTRDELAPAGEHSSHDAISGRIMRFDADHDGKVTEAELPERLRRVLDRADKNGDGAIDAAEAETIGERVRRREPRPDGATE